MTLTNSTAGRIQDNRIRARSNSFLPPITIAKLDITIEDDDMRRQMSESCGLDGCAGQAQRQQHTEQEK